MNIAATAPFNPAPLSYELIRELAQHRPVSPDLVFRRLKFIGAIIGLSVVGLASTLVLLGFDVPASEPAKQLTVFGFIAAAVALFSSLLSASLLLWGGFVSQYVSALDARADAAVSFDEAEDQIARATPTEANEDLLKTVKEEAVAVATALAEKVDLPRVDEGRQVLAELRAVMEHIEQLQLTLNTGEHERVFNSLRPRIVVMRQIRLRNAAAVEESAAVEVQTPLVG
jgi:hypothetical protein